MKGLPWTAGAHRERPRPAAPRLAGRTWDLGVIPPAQTHVCICFSSPDCCIGAPGPRLSPLGHSGCPPQRGLPTSLPPPEEQRKEEKPCSFHVGAACTPPAHARLLGSRARARKMEGKWKVWLLPGKPGVQLEPRILRSQMGQQLCLLLQLREATWRCLPLLCKAPGLKGPLSSSEFWVIHNNNCDYWLHECLIKTKNRRAN